MAWDEIYAVIGMPTIGLLGFAGVLLPTFTTYFFPKHDVPKKLYFSFFNGIAAGLILAVGYIHSLPDSHEEFEEWIEGDSLGDSYPWPAFISLGATLITFTIEEIADSASRAFGVANLHSHSHDDHEEILDKDEEDEKDIESQVPKKKIKSKKKYKHVDGEDQTESTLINGRDEEKTTYGSTKSATENGNRKSEDQASSEAVKPLTKMLILFFGLFFHNIFIGVALGISDSDRTLFLALIFHQFFEGVGLGSRVALADLKTFVSILVVDLIFALEAPVGIGIGLIAKSQLEDGHKTYGLVNGTFQAISGGILIYIALVHMARAYRETEAKGRNLEVHRWVSWCGCLFGAAVMAVIGIWA